MPDTMPQPVPPVAALGQLVVQCMDLYLFEDAKFYAEVLHAAKASVDSLLTLGDVLVKSGETQHCVRLLRHYYPFQEHFTSQRGKIAKLQYLYGVCLVRTQRYQEAETVFRTVKDGGAGIGEKSAILYWLGHIKKHTGRDTHAMESYAKCIHTCPFRWCAVEGFIDCSGSPNAFSALDSIYSPSRATEYAAVYFEQPQDVVQQQPVTPPQEALPSTPVGSRSVASRKKTPTTAPSKVRKRAGSGIVAKTPEQQQQQQQQQPVKSGEQLADDLRTLLPVLNQYAGVMSSCAAYDFGETLSLITDFPQPYVDTAYIQGLLAKAYYDEGLYTDACAAFEALRRAEPYRLDPKLMFYSSSLWQLQKDKQLAHLSQELIQMDKLSPVTQVVLGNTHSSVGEHPNAIQFFQRACSIDRYHAYASALKGMEHLVLEELDDAVQAFRSSIRLDPRQYTAWHGLGAVAAKQEKWNEASEHFKRASGINPSPPLLLAYASSLLEDATPACQELALATVHKVLKHQPHHSLARLRKGEILLRLGRLTEAKEVAVDLLESCPKESKVNILLGRVYRRLGDKMRALQCFNTALGLDPKDTPAVKYEVEKYQDGLDSGEE